ncbi:MAG: AtpZ/AtpI family protein [Candidatus Moraniibacteriota bacterium]
MNFIVLGFQMAILIVGGILGGIGLGYLADKYLVIAPWGIIFGIILGVILGGAAVYRIVSKE